MTQVQTAAKSKRDIVHGLIIGFFILLISALHYTTPTTRLQFHLIYMQSYFIPIILGAFWFGLRGGIITSVVISLIYLPHIMFQWGGFNLNNLIRFVQIGLFLALGYLTGIKAQGEQEEKERYRQTADALQKSLKELQRKTDQILEMEHQLKTADRLAIIGELTANLAHEVRNPLGSIRGAVEIIRDSVPDELKKLEFFDILLQETERLNSVVENYLNYAKRKSKMISRFDLREIVNDVVMMLKSKARKNGIQIKIDLSDRPLIIKGDSIHIWQILMNVLLNAIQAMPKGGTVMIEAWKADHTIHLKVRDQGTGIPKEALSRIFESFYTTKTNGTGLGLAIVKRIADKNHWGIRLTSTEKKGTEFVLEIPEDVAGGRGIGN